MQCSCFLQDVFCLVINNFIHTLAEGRQYPPTVGLLVAGEEKLIALAKLKCAMLDYLPFLKNSHFAVT